MPDTIMREEKNRLLSNGSRVYVVGSPLGKERHGKRERKGGREKGEGNYAGEVYTYGVFVCSLTAMGLEGHTRLSPGWSSPPLLRLHSQFGPHYMFTTGRNGLCADSSQGEH